MNGLNGNGSSSNEKLGQFVTNRWLVGAMLMLVMGMGGYIFSGIQRGTDAQASEVAELHTKANKLEVAVAADRAQNAAQYAEILRRLDRIDQYIYGSRPPR